MLIDQLQTELLQLLSLDKDNQTNIMEQLDKVIQEFGTKTIEKWENSTNSKTNTLLHELVQRDLADVIRHVIEKYGFDIHIKRISDNLTPFQLALKNPNSNMCDLLIELGAVEELTIDVSTWSMNNNKKNATNIVWLDLEVTCSEDPEILECAVLITDEDLNELARNNWVVHFDLSALQKLSEWHQDTFKDREKGGNGLFADVMESMVTKEQMEQELFDLLKYYCVEKECSLAGSSIHCVKEILKFRMPKVDDYLHDEIMDVTLTRQVPCVELNIEEEEIMKHRAMDDILMAISCMGECRLVRKKQQNLNLYLQASYVDISDDFIEQLYTGHYITPDRTHYGYNVNEVKDDSPIDMDDDLDEIEDYIANEVFGDDDEDETMFSDDIQNAFVNYEREIEETCNQMAECIPHMSEKDSKTKKRTKQ